MNFRLGFSHIYFFIKREAHQVACLGVTYRDWETLAFASLEGQQIEIARKAFVRVRDFKYLTLIAQFEVIFVNLLHMIILKINFFSGSKKTRWF